MPTRAGGLRVARTGDLASALALLVFRVPLATGTASTAGHRVAGRGGADRRRHGARHAPVAIGARGVRSRPVVSGDARGVEPRRTLAVPTQTKQQKQSSRTAPN